MATTARQAKKYYKADPERMERILKENKPLIDRMRKEGKLKH